MIFSIVVSKALGSFVDFDAQFYLVTFLSSVNDKLFRGGVKLVNVEEVAFAIRQIEQFHYNSISQSFGVFGIIWISTGINVKGVYIARNRITTCP